MFGFLRSRVAAAPAPVCTPDSRVGCFGKLPIQPEFIKHNASHREARALDQWLQGGVSLAARCGGEGAGPTPEQWVHCGVFAGTGEALPILFAIRPSTDRSGRRYPFVVFEVLGAREREAPPGLLPAHAREFFEAAAGVLRQPWRNEPLATVLGWVDRVEGLPRTAPRSVPTDRGAQQLLASLFPGSSEARGLAHLCRCAELLRQVERRTAPRVPWGLRLPLETQEPESAIEWWLRLAERVLGRGRWRPCFLWQPAGASGPAQLLLFFRLPPAQVVMHLLQGRGLEGAVVDPFAELPDSGGVRMLQACPATSQGLLDALAGEGAA